MSFGCQSINILAQLQSYFGDPRISQIEHVQSLWSGYGEIARYLSPKLQQSFIVKHISPPVQHTHPRGWNTTAGHQRKLLSYQIEANFYRNYAHLCDQYCVVPALLADFSENNQQLLVLQDLNHVGFSKRHNHCNMHRLKQGIKWLAYFHGRFLFNAMPDLWPIGTYWHLATRQDEYQVMQPSELKDAAPLIDAKLNQAAYQSLLHGDAKLANFCFPDDDDAMQLAAVDFQYVGRGVGVKDLIYFLGACLDSKALFSHAKPLLNEYFLQLHCATQHYQVQVDFSQLEAQWRDLYPFAWADFYRFLLGWSPEHYKINPYMQEQTKEALGKLK